MQITKKKEKNEGSSYIFPDRLTLHWGCTELTRSAWSICFSRKNFFACTYLSTSDSYYLHANAFVLPAVEVPPCLVYFSCNFLTSLSTWYWWGVPPVHNLCIFLQLEVFFRCFWENSELFIMNRRKFHTLCLLSIILFLQCSLTRIPRVLAQ